MVYCLFFFFFNTDFVCQEVQTCMHSIVCEGRKIKSKFCPFKLGLFSLFQLHPDRQFVAQSLEGSRKPPAVPTVGHRSLLSCQGAQLPNLFKAFSFIIEPNSILRNYCISAFQLTQSQTELEQVHLHLLWIGHPFDWTSFDSPQ